MEATSGTKAPAAIKALSLFSKTSSTSNGFFNTVGMAVPSASLMKTATISARAGPQKYGCANQGNCARWALGVLKYFHAPTALTPSNGEIATPVMVEIA